MKQHIRIRMSEQSLFIRDLHTAKDQLSAFHKLMHIITHSDSHIFPPKNRLLFDKNRLQFSISLSKKERNFPVFLFAILCYSKSTIYFESEKLFLCS